jgi:lipoyl(octanoyl) transferase
VSDELIIRPFAQVVYLDALTRMRAFTATRTAATVDELWLVEHEPVFTLGLAGKAEHLLAPGQIPVVKTERGGQVTFHGPGQVVVYLLLDLQRRRLSVRCLVQLIEDAVIDLLARYAVDAVRKPGAPGVYIGPEQLDAGAKIAALGIKVSRGCSYHGVALNVAMNLEPFSRINPCGYQGQAVTDLAQQILLNHRLNHRSAEPGEACDVAIVANEFGQTLAAHLAARREISMSECSA